MTHTQYHDELSSIRDGIDLFEGQYCFADNNSYPNNNVDMQRAREGIAAYRRYRGMLVRWFWESRIGSPPQIGVKP